MLHGEPLLMCVLRPAGQSGQHGHSAHAQLFQDQIGRGKRPQMRLRGAIYDSVFFFGVFLFNHHLRQKTGGTMGAFLL